MSTNPIGLGLSMPGLTAGFSRVQAHSTNAPDAEDKTLGHFTV